MHRLELLLLTILSTMCPLLIQGEIPAEEIIENPCETPPHSEPEGETIQSLLETTDSITTTPSLEITPDIQQKNVPQPSLKVFEPVSLDEALTSTVYRQLEIKIAEWNVNFQRGVIQQAAGPFDTVFNDRFTDTAINDEQSMPLNIKSNLNAGIFNNLLGAFKKTRLGTIFRVDSDFTRINSEFRFITRQQPNQRVNLGNLIVGIEQALLRGGWYGIDYQNEKAAIRELDAVKYDVLQTISEKVRDTTVAYWNFVGAIKRLIINKEVLAAFERLKVNIQKLIDAQEAAAGEIFQVMASLEVKKNNVIAAQFNLYLTMQQLLFAMGALDEKLCCEDCEFDQIIEVFPEYPNIESDLKILSLQTNNLISFAMKARFDIQASLIREEVQSIILKGLKNNTLPQLNLFSEMATRDYKLGDKAKNLYSDLYFQHPQIDWRVGVSFSMPLCNDAAIGAYKQGWATLNQSIIQTQFIKEQIIRDVLITLKNQIDLALRIAEVNKSVKYYEKVVADQYEKLAAGFTTLFELISYENDLANTRLLQNDLYVEYNNNLANLRFFSGTLISLQECCGISIEDVTTIPLVDGLKGGCP